MTISTAKFRAMWNDPSLTRDEIALAMGLSVSAIKYRAKKLGLPARQARNRLAILTVGAVSQLVGEGLTDMEIGQRLGVSHNAVWGFRARNGISDRRKPTREELEAAGLVRVSGWVRAVDLNLVQPILDHGSEEIRKHLARRK